MITILPHLEETEKKRLNQISDKYRIAEIQPHGVLLVVREDLTILQVSDNVNLFFGYEPMQLLNQPLTILFAAAELLPLQTLLSSPHTHNLSNPFFFNSFCGHETLCCFQAVVYYTHQMLILELEPAFVLEQSPHWYYQQVQLALGEFQKMENMTAILTQAIKMVRYLTHYHYMAVYQLDEWGNAHVVTQDKSSDVTLVLESLLPASVISKLAYQLSPNDGMQLIVEIGCRLAKLVPPLLPSNGEPLNLRFSTLRTWPLLAEKYLLEKNFKSMLLIPLFQRNQLWGWFIGYHQMPQSLSYSVRKSCEMMAQILSFPLSTLPAQRAYLYRRLPPIRMEPQLCLPEEKPCCRMAMQALRESEEFYRSVITSLEEGVILQNADGTTYALNASAERILGSTARQEMQTSSHYLHWQAISEEGYPFTYQTHPVIGPGNR